MKTHMEGLKVTKHAGNYGASPETIAALVEEKTLKDSLQDYFEPEEVEKLQNAEGEPTFPPNATLCYRCMYKAVVILDGCKTCLNCGDSKCG